MIEPANVRGRGASTPQPGLPIDSFRMHNRIFGALFQNALWQKEHNDGEYEQTVQ